jgi:hypothetical protein
MRIQSALMLGFALFVVGCGNDHGQPPHTADEQKAVDDYNKLTPQQQIDRAQNSPLPQGAKEGLIKSIKDKNGMK